MVDSERVEEKGWRKDWEERRKAAKSGEERDRPSWECARGTRGREAVNAETQRTAAGCRRWSEGV